MRFAALALALAACASPAVRDPAARGRAEAEEEIARGEPCLLETGRLVSDSSLLDRETGLRIRSLGCLVDDETDAFVNAHNDAIRAARAEGRLHGMTYEDRWMTEESVAARFEGEGGVLLLAGDAPLAEPSGRFRVEIAPRSDRGDAACCLFVTDSIAGTRRVLLYLGGPSARVLFAHGGRTLLVRDGPGSSRSLDLARAIGLQWFWD